MADWEYRAFDANRVVHEGRETAPSFPVLALNLRQRGLQILEATKLNKDDSLATKRLEKMKARVEPPDEEPVAQSTDSSISSAIRRLFSALIPPFLKRSSE